MNLILRAVFREYKSVWFKTLCTLIGLVISLSLFIVVELFSYLFQSPAASPQAVIPYTHKIVHTNGFLQTNDLNELFKNKAIRLATPTREVFDVISQNDKVTPVIITGADQFSIIRELAKQTPVNRDELPSIDLLDLNTTILVTKTCTTTTKQIPIRLNNQSLMVTCIELDLPDARLLMDIAQFQRIYPPSNGIDALMIKTTPKDANALERTLATNLPGIKLISLADEQNQQSQWVRSLTYNLKFLALISLIVSTCLMIQFFRFLGKERQPLFSTLFQLGVNQQTIKQLFMIEMLLISIGTVVLALTAATGIAKLSLTTFNQVITMFYFKLNATNVMLHWSIIVKTIIATTVAFGVAYISFFYGQSFGNSNKQVRRVGLVSAIAVPYGLLLITKIPTPITVIIGSILVLFGFFGLSIGCIGFIGHALRRITSHRGIRFKMTRDTLLKDPLSYGAIVFVIALSGGLILSMNIFIKSFSTTVFDWLDTVTFHDVYIQHNANSIQYPVALPPEVIKLTQQLPENVSVSTLQRVPFIFNGLPAQIVFRKDIHDPTRSRFIFKQKLTGPTQANDAFISEPFAAKHNLNLGDTVELNGITKGPVRVAGIVFDFVSEFGQLMTNINQMANANDTIQLHGIAVKAPSNQRDRLQSYMAEASSIPNTLVASQESILATSMQIFHDTFSFTWFVVIITGCIAIFSLVNLMTIVCINRKNELIQLWHIGFNSTALRQIVLAQIALISVVAGGMAVAIGGALYILIVYGIQQPSFNWTIFLAVPWVVVGLTPIVIFGLSQTVGTWFMIITGPALQQERINDVQLDH
ncbi:MAG: ABC transporter permease [Candidatus Marinamargulisbacteria bacterium]